jgi:Protein of unknown function (DUF4019)
MARLILPWVLTVSLLSAFGAVRAAASTPEAAGRTAAEQWLKLVDTAKYPESWALMDDGFQKAVSRRKWKTAIAEIRRPLGKLASRNFQSAQYSKELPGAPEGEYVVVQYESTFEHKTHTTEKVTLKLGQDLIWRVSSYSVK